MKRPKDFRCSAPQVESTAGTAKMRFRHAFQTIYLRMNSLRTIDYATYEKKSSSREEIATSSLVPEFDCDIPSPYTRFSAIARGDL